MSDENKEIEAAAAAAAGVAVANEGFVAQGVKGVKIAFATKKAAMAAYALFFGVTAATSSYVANGMTSAELQERKVMEETIVTLNEQVVELETKVVKLNAVHGEDGHSHDTTHEHEEHKHPGIVALIDLSKESVPSHMHEFVPHSHNLEEHEHDTSLFSMTHHTHPHKHDTTHEHEPVDMGRPSEEYKHKNPRHDSCGRACH